MGFRGVLQLVASDLFRHEGRTDALAFCRCIAKNPGFNCTFWFRMASCARGESLIIRIFSPLLALVKHHYEIKYGISIPRTAQIGPGFYIGHFGGIVVHGDCRIGRDCNISQSVTLGVTNRGRRAGVPTIGDRVYVGPGAKIIGAVRIGSNVAVGANAVVTHDVPDNAVVAGVPAKIISYAGSVGYIDRTDYPEPGSF
jgi:serine O-acetyltransferase